MLLTIFLALCILGCDFLLIVLFQWVYGEKRRFQFLRPNGRKGKSATGQRSPIISRSFRGSSLPPSPSARVLPIPSASSRSREQLAHRRIADSLLPTRSRP